MQKQYPEVHSLEESLAILKKYKDDLKESRLKSQPSLVVGLKAYP